MGTGSKPKQYRQSTKCKMLSYQTFQGGKKKAFLKAKIEDLETNSKIRNIRELCRGFSDFKNGYHPKNNTEKDEKGD